MRMRILALIIVLLFVKKFNGQTTINSITLDSVGLLKLNITFVEPNLKYDIQRNLLGKWITILKTGYEVDYFTPPAPTYNPRTISDSLFVPLYKGTNNYRIVINVPSQLESKVVSTYLFQPNKKNYLYAKENYIRFENKVGFSISDSNGQEVRKSDIGRMINVTDLKKGLYYIIVRPYIYEFEKK